VFAIAITLLVLDIVVPASAGSDLLRSVAGLWPSYLAYVVSFSTIGASWLGHNAITEYLERANATFVRLNLLLLLLIAFLPFPTRLFADYMILIVVGLFVPVVAVIGYLAIALYYVIPFRRPGRIHLFGRGRPDRPAP
jgi:uncharacterized membrane protein